MDGLRRLLVNGASLLGAYVLPRVCTFGAAIVAARVLGVEAFGAYGTAAALAVLLSIAATLGMMQLLVRDLARAPETAVELMGAANLAKGASSVLMLGLLAALLAGPLDYPPDVVACGLLLGLSYAVGSWVENLGAWFQAVERMPVWMHAQALFGLTSGIGAVVAVLETGSVVWFAAAPVAGQGVALAYLLARAPAPVRTAWRAPWPVVARLLRSLAPFTLSVVALTAYAKVDVLLVERWHGLGEAGIYAAAYKFVDVAQALALVVATALYPRLSRSAATAGRPTGSDRAPDPTVGRHPTPDPAAGRTAELLLLAGVPAAALLWLLRGPVVAGVFGASYAPSAAALGFLAPALPILALNVLGTYVLAASGRMSTAAALYGGGLAVNVALNVILVPGLGATGAAAARLASEVALGIAMTVALRHLVGTVPSGRVAAASATAAGAAILVRWPELPLPGTAGLYLAAAALVYAASRVVPTRELALLNRAVRR